MKKIATVSLLLTLITLSTAFVSHSKKARDVTQICHSGGISGYTGFSGESNCNTCHSVPFGTGDSSSIAISTIPNITNYKYKPGQTYTVHVLVASKSLNHFGFDCEILNSASGHGTTVGTIAPLAAYLTQTVMLFYPNQRMNVTHGIPAQGVSAGNKNEFTFAFLWKAPVSDSAFINVGGMAVNVDSYSSGDDIAANKSIALTPETAAAISEFEISRNSALIYPNPSSDVVNVQYNLAEDGEVTTDLMDLSGNVLAELFSCKQGLGKHMTTVFIPSHIKAGAYLLRISLDAKQFIEKLIVVEGKN